ncbi:MAG: type II secretion system F family protein [Phycisphaerales bacterium]
MPLFAYTALNPTGQRVAGVLNSASEQAVLAELESRQLVPVAISAREERRLPWRRRVGTHKLAATYLQIADLLRAGVPVLRALKLLGGRKSSPALAAICRDLAEAVSQGDDLAEAMSRHPDAFPQVHVAMVRAGEKGGFLEEVMSRLGQFVQSQAELRGKVIGNLVYPMVLVGFGAIVLGVIFGVFVPKFKPIFAQIDPLPTVTKVVFGASALVADYGPYTIAALAVLALVGWRLVSRPEVRRRLAVARTRAPIIGPIIRSLAAARFCRLLGTMLSNGIPMLTAMQIARDAAGNVLLEDAIDSAVESVRAGQTLSMPLASSGLLSDDVVEMISVAETANNLDEVLLTIAATIEGRVDRMLGVALRLVEPVLLLLIALVVATVAAGLILPMTQMRAGF